MSKQIAESIQDDIVRREAAYPNFSQQQSPDHERVHVPFRWIASAIHAAIFHTSSSPSICARRHDDENENNDFGAKEDIFKSTIISALCETRESVRQCRYCFYPPESTKFDSQHERKEFWEYVDSFYRDDEKISTNLRHGQWSSCERGLIDLSKMRLPARSLYFANDLPDLSVQNNNKFKDVSQYTDMDDSTLRSANSILNRETINELHFYFFRDILSKSLLLHFHKQNQQHQLGKI